MGTNDLVPFFWTFDDKKQYLTKKLSIIMEYICHSSKSHRRFIFFVVIYCCFYNQSQYYFPYCLFIRILESVSILIKACHKARIAKWLSLHTIGAFEARWLGLIVRAKFKSNLFFYFYNCYYYFNLRFICFYFEL